jgi:hypothetical protein
VTPATREAQDVQVEQVKPEELARPVSLAQLAHMARRALKETLERLVQLEQKV